MPPRVAPQQVVVIPIPNSKMTGGDKKVGPTRLTPLLTYRDKCSIKHCDGTEQTNGTQLSRLAERYDCVMIVSGLFHTAHWHMPVVSIARACRGSVPM